VRVVLSTRNRATAHNLDAARRALDRLASASDPAVYFVQLMKETARRSEGSGLGLARVRAESEMSLSYEIHGDLIELHASADFRRGGAS
jgi:hypothetical protein